MTANLFTAFAPFFKKAADKPALLCPADDAVITYGDLEREVARLANLLRAEGVAPGDRVAVQVEKSAENVVLYLACLKAGAVYLPLNTAYTDHELDYFFGDAEPRLIVCDPKRADGIRKLGSTGEAVLHSLDANRGGTLMQAASSMSDDSQTVQRAAGDLAAILYTSGTTGRSKGAMVTHGNLRANAETLIEAWRISADDVLLHALPIYHVHGLFVALNTCLMTGAQILFHPKFDTDAVFDDLPNATLMMGVPTFYTRLLASDRLTKERCRNMRLFIAGSAPLLDETFRAFEHKTGHAILERYGMTETGMLCSNPLNGERRPGTVGPPLADVEARVADEQGSILDTGEVGVLEVRGPNVFKGYWRMPDKTKEEFRDDGFFITGDISRIDEDGYVHIVGRAKDMIISGGFNVYPKEIEAVIDQVDGVGESAVIGLPHPDFGEGVAAVVASGDGLDQEAVVAACKAELAGYKVPKAVFVVDALPRNTMGKVQKNQLRERYAQAFI
ncbi:MAG: malonyl-CoA synthase [Alphaproteobacteria bacterium]|nr:malonyl-CoA synthase [Alphaproteobacteria bacterium]